MGKMRLSHRLSPFFLRQVEFFLVELGVGLDDYGAAQNLLEFLKIRVLVGFEQLGHLGETRSNTFLALDGAGDLVRLLQDFAHHRLRLLT